MSRPVYRYNEGSLHDRFHQSRAKIRIFGGGYGNGKTAAMCIDALHVGNDYPGANILMARSTYPKLNDTLRKEFIKWCPPDWIESFPKSTINTCTLINGTNVNFRYVKQDKSNGNEGTSNLLSATYDAIYVDQIEDPEFSEKDFLDLLGRLRGNAQYDGEDPTMPRTGPRLIVLSCNPTRNWVYKKLVRPLQIYMQTGRRTDDLLWDEQNDCPMIELFEGSTYENEENLGSDYMRTLEAAYKGQMRDRFLLGKWAAYEGLVYPDWNSELQIVNHEQMFEWFIKNAMQFNRQISIHEGYDYGLAQPACYGLFFTDVDGNVHLIDGFYEKELPVSVQAEKIVEIRSRYLGAAGLSHAELEVIADPAIFRRTVSSKKGVVGETIAQIFRADTKAPIRMIAGDNDIVNGIARNTSYLIPHAMHRNPYTLERGAPHFYVSDNCDWFDDEITSYMWKKSTDGENVDMPEDKNDHGMDMWKFAFSRKPVIPHIIQNTPPPWMTAVSHWREIEDSNRRSNRPRHR